MTKERPSRDPASSAATKRTEEIGPILSRWLTDLRVPERLGQEGIFGKWKEIVGEEIAALTRVASCTGGVLCVEVASAPLLLELAGYYRQSILDSIRARPEFQNIHQIRFRAGSVPPRQEDRGRDRTGQRR